MNAIKRKEDLINYFINLLTSKDVFLELPGEKEDLCSLVVIANRKRLKFYLIHSAGSSAVGISIEGYPDTLYFISYELTKIIHNLQCKLREDYEFKTLNNMIDFIER